MLLFFVRSLCNGPPYPAKGKNQSIAQFVMNDDLDYYSWKRKRGRSSSVKKKKKVILEAAEGDP